MLDGYCCAAFVVSLAASEGLACENSRAAPSACIFSRTRPQGLTTGGRYPHHGNPPLTSASCSSVNTSDGLVGIAGSWTIGRLRLIK